MIYPLYYIIPAVLTVLALYSLGHYNLYRLLSPLLGKKPWQRRLFIGVAIFLWSSPFTVALLSRLTIPALTPAIAMTGYVWLGFFIILTVLSMVFHLGVLLVWLLNRARRGKKPLRLPHVQRALPFMMLLAGLLTLWGLFEARDIKTHTLQVTSGKLAPGVTRVRIVQISDVHFSAVTDATFARRLARRIEALKPDIIISTGDLLDRGIMDWKGTTGALAQLKAPGGKFAITGNHEFISGLPYSEKFHKDAGFDLIRNGIRRLPRYNITLVGVDDLSLLKSHKENNFPELALLREAGRGTFRIVLKHQPFVHPGAIGTFDLQLSGHTHGGQIFPLRYLISLVFKYFTGLYNLGKGSWIYVNRGTGTWGPPLRLLTPPEITVIEISPPSPTK